MIPLREQEQIKELFENALDGPVKLEYFTQRPSPVIVPGREDCLYCPDVELMLTELTHLSTKLSLKVQLLAAAAAAKRYGVERVPATVIRGVLNRPIIFYGIPALELFAVLIELCVGVSRGATDLPAKLKQRLKRIKRDLPVTVFVTPDDPQSPLAALAAAALALEHGRIKLSIVEVSEFPALAERLGVDRVPYTLIDNHVRVPGALPPQELLDQFVKAAERTTITPESRIETGIPDGTTALNRGQAQRAPQEEVRPSGLIIPRR